LGERAATPEPLVREEDRLLRPRPRGLAGSKWLCEFEGCRSWARMFLLASTPEVAPAFCFTWMLLGGRGEALAG